MTRRMLDNPGKIIAAVNASFLTVQPGKSPVFRLPILTHCLQGKERCLQTQASFFQINDFQNTDGLSWPIAFCKDLKLLNKLDRM